MRFPRASSFPTSTVQLLHMLGLANEVHPVDRSMCGNLAVTAGGSLVQLLGAKPE